MPLGGQLGAAEHSTAQHCTHPLLSCLPEPLCSLLPACCAAVPQMPNTQAAALALVQTTKTTSTNTQAQAQAHTQGKTRLVKVGGRALGGQRVVKVVGGVVLAALRGAPRQGQCMQACISAEARAAFQGRRSTRLQHAMGTPLHLPAVGGVRPLPWPSSTPHLCGVSQRFVRLVHALELLLRRQPGSLVHHALQGQRGRAGQGGRHARAAAGQGMLGRLQAGQSEAPGPSRCRPTPTRLPTSLTCLSGWCSSAERRYADLICASVAVQRCGRRQRGGRW